MQSFTLETDPAVLAKLDAIHDTLKQLLNAVNHTDKDEWKTAKEMRQILKVSHRTLLSMAERGSIERTMFSEKTARYRLLRETA